MKRAAALVLVAWILGCGTPSAAPETQPSNSPTPVAQPPESSPSSPPDATAQPERRAVALITDPAVLVALESAGLTAGPIAFGSGDGQIRSFAGTQSFRDLRKALAGDVAAQRRTDPKAGVGMRHGHRLFDMSWLDSDKTRLELIGVVNRADRRPFAPEHCGETRLIYRLAYTAVVDGETIDSRLPMTVNVVLWQDDGARCAAAAQRWMVPPNLRGAALAEHLRGRQGPLAAERVGRSQLKSVEINVQVLRWPAVMHPSLGGHAAYVLRVFHPSGAGLDASALENTPDVARLRSSRREREALLAWLRDPKHLAALDDGTAVIPERFSAEVAISVTPRGLGRVANRPFSQLMKPDDFADLDFSGLAHIRSPRGLIRRLDGLTCNGCHETRSVAGFHLLGEPRDPDRVLDTMFVPTSPHLDGELARRRTFTRAMAQGKPADPARPLSDFERNAGGYGAHCGLGDPGFAAWTCAPGLHCVTLDDPDMGTCLPKQARTAGDPCEVGELRTRTVATKDRVRKVRSLACAGAAVCNTNRVGFPGGMCTTTCADLQPGEGCGAIVNLATFNLCIGRRRPFPKCIEEAAFEAGMRACDADHRCREDYICARSPSSPQQGVCLPPYFLFQMRVDGHVL